MAVQSLTISIGTNLIGITTQTVGSTKPKQSSGHRLESAPGLLSLALLLQRDDSWICCPTSDFRHSGCCSEVDAPTWPRGLHTPDLTHRPKVDGLSIHRPRSEGLKPRSQLVNLKTTEYLSVLPTQVHFLVRFWATGLEHRYGGSSKIFWNTMQLENKMLHIPREGKKKNFFFRASLLCLPAKRTGIGLIAP